MSFDHNPDDSELTCLLGDPLRRGAQGLPVFGVGAGAFYGVKSVEDGGVLTVSPWLFPMKWCRPLAVLAVIGCTCLMCLEKCQRPSFEMLWPLLILWLVGLPVVLGALWMFNLIFASAGDFFRVDSSQRTLESCRAGRTFRADEIIAFTEVSRYYRISTKWCQTQQTGVLVRAANQSVEWHPLISDRDHPWADRLAGIFQVPVRRVKLSRSESRALNDC